ncbi:MAG: hypothetical protein ACM3SU_05650 [Acidobacteriota bacterium]
MLKPILRLRSCVVLAAVSLGLGAGRLEAQTPPPSPESEAQWHFAAGLYGFFPALKGTVTAADQVHIPIDVSFSELFDHLKLNLTGHFEAQTGRIGFGIDTFYVKLGVDIPGALPEQVEAKLRMRQFIGETFGFYQVARGSGEHPWSLEAIGGIRFWDTNVRIESDIADINGKSTSWVDGFGGLRLQIPIGPRLIVLGRGDVGGGGARLDWSASGDLAYRLGKGWIVGAGYRTLDVEYRKLTVWDIGYDGPRVWIVYSW